MTDETNIGEDQVSEDASIDSSDDSQSNPNDGDQTPESKGYEYDPNEVEEWKSGYLRQEDYTRKTQALAAKERELETRMQQWDQRLKSFSETPMSPEEKFQMMQARETLDKYGIATKDDLAEVYSKAKEEALAEVRQQEEARLQKEAYKAVESSVSQLASKYDGVDGKPKFNGNEVRKYMVDKGLGRSMDTLQEDMEMAYKMMHYDRLLDWEKRNPTKPRVNPTSPSQLSQIIEEKKDSINSFDDAGRVLSEHFDKLGI